MFIFFFSETVSAQDSSFHFTTSDGVDLYVRTAGKGNPCVFLHGGPGLTSYYFEALPAARLIEQKVHMIYFDQRGGGRSSSAKDSNYSVKRMEKDIDELRIFLKIKKWSVMGHSFGGLVMTAYAKDYPENIQSLVYVHCTIHLDPSLQSHIENGVRLLKELGDTIQVNGQLSRFGQLMQVDNEMSKKAIYYKIMFRSQREKDIDDSLTDAATPHFNQDFAHRVWTLKDYWIDYTPFTKDIRSPVLVITGTEDYAVGPESYKSWQFKNMKIALYNGAHFSFLEEPAWFADTVLQFLNN
jgi:proline iminopeptidase